MMLPHERPLDGPAGDFAARLRAELPVLKTDRLILRAPAIGDFPHYADIAASPEGRYLTDDQTRKAAWLDFAQVTAIWLLRGHGLWTIEDRKTGQTLGFVLLGFEPGDHEPELGYMLLPSARGKGIALEAGQAARDYAFETAGLQHLVSTIDPANTASQKLAKRLGAQRDPKAEAAHGHHIQVWRHPAGGACA
jgi:RimJ/RimL family protein N-acetyltransferase